ncbi:MAG: hypothetical protein DLM55_06550 [Acidimicrobiales bacterium]|nr:MAG: hypothetical protein DLM55_06550 [Acidimicrobiales bacterium]
MTEKLSQQAVDALIERYAAEEEPRAAKAFERAALRGRGRPTLPGTDDGEASPQVAFRLPPSLNEKLTHVAQEQHTTRSKLARHALEEYLAARS